MRGLPPRIARIRVLTQTLRTTLAGRNAARLKPCPSFEIFLSFLKALLSEEQSFSAASKEHPAHRTRAKGRTGVRGAGWAISRGDFIGVAACGCQFWGDSAAHDGTRALFPSRKSGAKSRPEEMQWPPKWVKVELGRFRPARSLRAKQTSPSSSPA